VSGIDGLPPNLSYARGSTRRAGTAGREVWDGTHDVPQRIIDRHIAGTMRVQRDSRLGTICGPRSRRQIKRSLTLFSVSPVGWEPIQLSPLQKRGFCVTEFGT
jgi:hypothetical protein